MTDTGSINSANRLRVFTLAYHISPHDSRYLKLRASFQCAGFEIAAAAPTLHPLHASVIAIEAGPAPRTTFGAWRRARRVARALVGEGAAFRPDVIYAFDPEVLPAALRLKQRTNAALIYDAHEFHEDEDPNAPARGAWVRRAERSATPQLDGFITVNASIARLYQSERKGLPAPVIAHNAVDPIDLAPYDGRLHKAAGLPEDARILLFQGGLAAMRGLGRLVAVGALLNPEWRVVIMGRGPLLEQLKASADHARVRFIGPADFTELASWTQGAALGALFYEDHGRNQHYCSPNKLWEYAAAGVPVIAVDLPEIARVVRGAQTGFMVPPDASPEVISGVVNAIEQNDLAKVRCAALKFSISETWSSQAAPIIELIEALGGDRRAIDRAGQPHARP